MRGDLRDAHSLVPALAGVDTVVTTANALSRIMAGDKDLTLSAVDVDGKRKLVRAAEDAGVRRYLFLSAAGLDHGMGRHAPLAAAKLATEELPRHGPMEAVLAVLTCSRSGWPRWGGDRRSERQGDGLRQGRHPAPLCRHGRRRRSPRPSGRCGAGAVDRGVRGPEALTVNEAVAAFGEAIGRALKTRHVPRPVLSIASRLMARPKPALASLMAMALHSDTHPSAWDEEPLRETGVDPRPATAYITESVATPG